MKKFSEIMDLMDSARFLCMNNLDDVGGVLDEVKEIDWDNVEYDISCDYDDMDYISDVYAEIRYYKARHFMED